MSTAIANILTFLSQTGEHLASSAESFLAAGITVLEPLPGIDPNSITFAELLSRWYFIFVSLAAVLAFAMIVWGAAQYAVSEATGGKEQAKTRIRNAVFGLILMLASYLILYTIDPNLVKFNLSRLGKVGSVRTGGPTTDSRVVTQQTVSAAQELEALQQGRPPQREGVPTNGYYLVVQDTGGARVKYFSDQSSCDTYNRGLTPQQRAGIGGCSPYRTR